MENQEETVVLEIEGCPVECTKKILIENSDYFSAMFKGSFKESYEKKIKIQGVDLKSFNTILLLLWDESYIIDIADIHMLLQAACMLQFNAIKKVCEDKILQHLNPSICIKIWKTAELLDIAPLWLKAKSMALESFMDISESKSVLELSLDDICLYLGHIHLNINNELLVFHTAMNWWYENQEHYEDVDATKVFLRLLNCIDFKKLKSNEIKEMQTFPDIAENSEMISVLNCIIKLLGNEVKVHYEFSDEHLKYATHLLSSKSREVPVIPCLLLQTDRYNPHCPNKKLKLNEKNDQDVVVYDKFRRRRYMHEVSECPGHDKMFRNNNISAVIYDGTTNTFRCFFTIDGDKIKDLVGFKLVSNKEFVHFYGGEFIIGGGNWNFNVWTYDTIREKWERKSVLPEGRRHFETILADDRIYIVGGVGKFRVIQENLLWYDFKSDEWNKASLPYSTNYKCCSFNNELVIINLSDKQAYIFNASLKIWRPISIKIDKEVTDDMGDFTVLADSQYLYVKGKHLIKFKLDGVSLVPLNRRVMKDVDYEEIESVLCNNTIYTLYKGLDEHYNFFYTFEAFSLETESLYYIFRDKIQEHDAIQIEGKLFYSIPYTRLFCMRCYYFVKENSLINNFLP